MTMKSYLEQIHKAFNEKFMPQQDRVPYYIEYEEAKAFFDEQLKAFVEMKKSEIKQAKQDDHGYCPSRRQGLVCSIEASNEGLDKAIKILESEEAEDCSWCSHLKDRHFFGVEEHCKELDCVCERYVSD